MEFINTLSHNIQNNWLNIILLITAIAFNIIVLKTKTSNPKLKKSKKIEIDKIVKYIMEAEQKLGSGQGLAKMNYVLSKLNKSTDDKKAIKEIEKTLLTMKEYTKELTKDTKKGESNNEGI